MLVDPDEYPSFYKLLFKEGSMDKILLPPAFIQENKNMLAKTCLLKTDEGVFWEAKIVREKSGYFICKGEWRQFVEYHKLELGDVLLFFLIDKSIFQVLPYKQKRYKNLNGRQVFEELSSSSKDDDKEEGEGEEEEREVDSDGEEEEEEEEGEREVEGDGEEKEEEEEEEEEREVEGDGEEEEEEEEPPRISKKRKMQATELSDNSDEESDDSSSGSKDGECPHYSHSGFIMNGVKSIPEADNILLKNMKAPGLKLLLKACQDKPEKPAHSILGWKLKRRRGMRDNDPDNHKQPTSAFFIFMEEFKKQFMKKNPRINSVYVVDRAGGEKWKQLSDADKAPYIAEANKRKVEHKKNMRAYCVQQASGSSKEEESDKSRSVVVEEDEGCRQLKKFPWMRKHVISSARTVEEEEEAESGSEENVSKKIKSSMVNFNNKDPNFKVVVKKVSDTGKPLKTYLRRKYR